jgi:hypothetical protein
MIALVYWPLLSLLPVPESATDYSSQTYYDILKNDKVIGYMMCSKVEKSETIEYITESSARFSVLVDISVYSKLQSSFSNGILLDGRLIRQVNGKTKADRQIAWVQDQYLIKSDGRSLSFKSKIRFSTACLMYAEPSGMTRIFSENFGQYVTINETAPHGYVLTLPDGKDNIYTYHNGKCTEVEVHTSLATVYIKLRK